MITKGLLYAHVRRPEWGFGMLVSVDGFDRYTMRFTDVGIRKCTSEFLREVDLDAETEPEAKPAKVETTQPAKRRVAARQPRTASDVPRSGARDKCPQCGGPRPPDRWGCDPCRARKLALRKAKREAAPKGPPKLRGGKGYPWTDAELDRLREMAPKSKTDRELVAHFPGRSIAMIGRVRIELGMPRAEARQAWPPEKVAEHDAMSQAGATIVAIAAALGVTVQAIKSFRTRRRKALEVEQTRGGRE